MFMNHAKAQWVLVVRLERAGAPGLTGLFRLVSGILILLPLSVVLGVALLYDS